METLIRFGLVALLTIVAAGLVVLCISDQWED
jgi:hypothetical protein